MSIAPVFVTLTSENVQTVKRALRAHFPQLQSAHLTEALAAAFGKRTHAALLADLAGASSDKRFVALDESAFADRLKTLSGHSFTSPKKGGLFHALAYPEGAEPILTWSPDFDRPSFKTQRQQAWRAMMVAAINAGVERGLFSMTAGDDRWPSADPKDPWSRNRYDYPFKVGDIPAVASVENGGFGELRVFVVFWPTPNSSEWLHAVGDHFLAGDAHADGWLERRDGAYLQVSSGKPSIRCRQARLATVVAIKIEPICYADRGSFRM